MKTIFVILKNTQGIFSVAMNPKYPVQGNIVYHSINEDKINMRSDINAFLLDFRKATNEAKMKQMSYE